MKTVVISGANRGIGLALVGEFTRAGYRVIAGVRDPERAGALSSFVKAGTCVVSQLDVSDDASVKAFARGVEAVDILVNNAGMVPEARWAGFEEHSVEDLRTTIDTNCLGAFRLTQALMPQLKKSGSPIVANMSSLMGSMTDNTSGGAYAYRISKAAMNMLTKTLSVEFPKMTTISLHPGWVQTDMGGKQAPVMPADSAAGLFRVITSVTLGDSGGFIDFKGKKLPW